MKFAILAPGKIAQSMAEAVAGIQYMSGVYISK